LSRSLATGADAAAGALGFFGSTIKGVIDIIGGLFSVVGRLISSLLSFDFSVKSSTLARSAGATSFGVGNAANPLAGLAIGAATKGFSAGGIASGPTSGYAATLHGTEAVVPLPNNKSIPVELNKGAGASNTNNVSVNIAIDSNGNASAQVTNDGRAEQFGTAISAAVQKEIINQTRAGGLLYNGR
jgi:hypothetical protein